MKHLRRIKFIFWCLIALAFVTGCSTTVQELTNEPPYSKYINHKYSINEDCYVFYSLDEPNIYLIGLAARCSALPKEVDAKYINRTQNRVKIIGILPKGSVFQIAALYREHNFESSYYLYKVKMIGSFYEKWPLLDASLITDELQKPPIIKPTYATPIN